MSTYTVRIRNNSQSPKKYAICACRPDVQGSNKVFTPVIDQKQCYPGEEISFTVRGEYMAICGNAQGPLQQRTATNVYQSRPMSGGSSLQLELEDGMPRLQGGSSAAPNTYEIRTGGFNQRDAQRDNLWAGYGVRTDGGDVRAVAIFALEPQLRIAFTAGKQFYISSGEYMTGNILDVPREDPREGGGKIVEFSGKNPLTFSQEPNGVFRPQ